MTASIAAEQALLGAVLLDPEGQRHLLAVVAPGDFARPWHGQVLAAMRRLDGRGEQPGLAEVHGELKADPDLPRQVSHDGALLADLADAAPRPSHAPAYAGLVISAAIRRRASLAGARISQAADGAAELPFLNHADLDHAWHTASLARRELDRCRSRWEALPGPVRAELPVPRRDSGVHADAVRRAVLAGDEITRLHTSAWSQDSGVIAERLAAVTQLLSGTAAGTATHRDRRALRAAGQEARPAGQAAEAAGLAVLRDLAADPARLADVAVWLRPGHFASPGHGEAYAALRDLHAAGMPADPVTTCWEARRRGVVLGPRDLAGGTGALTAGHARQLWRRACLARASQAGLGIQACAADPGLTVTAVLSQAAGRLERLDRDPGPEFRRARRDGAAVVALPSRAARPSAGRADGDHAREAAQ